MKLRVVALALTGALILGIGALAFLTRARLTPVERGRRLAEATGCFACHGAEGIRGMANPGRDEKQVPAFEGTLMMYAKNPEEVREWIRDGGTKTRREDPDWQAERKLGVVRMPAFGRRLSASQIETSSRTSWRWAARTHPTTRSHRTVRIAPTSWDASDATVRADGSRARIPDR